MVKMVYIAAITGIAGIPATSDANPPGCCIIHNQRTASLGATVRYQITLLGGSVTSASAAGAAGALVFESCRNETFGDCPLECPDLAFLADFDSDAVDLKNDPPLDVNASVLGTALPVSGEGDIEWYTLTGTTEATHGSGSLRDSPWDTSPHPCTPNGYMDVGSVGWGIASAAGTWTITGDYTFVVSVKLEAASDGEFEDGCEVNCARPDPNPPPFDHVAFFTVTRTRGVTSSTDQGVFATFEDGSTIRRGFYTNAAFNPTPTDDGFTLSSGYVNLPSLGGSGSSYSVDVKQDHFTGFTGDLNADEQTCWTDREDFMNRIGATINSANYNARADFDLDGDVDNNDLNHFNDIGCTADVNCSGGLTSADYDAFVVKFNANDPSADMNNDTYWNFSDYTEFVNTYNAGCP